MLILIYELISVVILLYELQCFWYYVFLENKLSQLDDLKFESNDQPDEHFPTIMIDPKKTFQSIVGFGGSLTDASSETFYKLSKENQERILTAYFDKLIEISKSEEMQKELNLMTKKKQRERNYFHEVFHPSLFNCFSNLFLVASFLKEI